MKTKQVKQQFSLLRYLLLATLASTLALPIVWYANYLTQTGQIKTPVQIVHRGSGRREMV